MNHFLSPLQQASRFFRSKPAFALTLSTLVALSVGAATATFSLTRHILFRDLPYPDPPQLVLISETNAGGYHPVRIPTYDALIEQSQLLETASIGHITSVLISGLREPIRTDAVKVSSEFFPILGAQPFIGRTFEYDEQFSGRDNVIIISQSFWKGHFESNPSILGKSIVVNDRPHNIVGIMPTSFEFPRFEHKWIDADRAAEAELFLPVKLDEPLANQLSNFNYFMIGRIDQSANRESLISEYRVIRDRLNATYPGRYDDWWINVTDIESAIRGRYEIALWIFNGAVFAFIIIASLNISTLLLVQGVTRRRTISTLIALGSMPRNILSQMFAEFLAVILLGGTFGYVASVGILKGLIAFSPMRFSQIADTSIDLYSFAMALTLLMFSCSIIVAVPYLKLAGVMGTTGLNVASGSKSQITTVANRRSIASISLAQVTIASTLVFSAGLLVKSFLNLLEEDSGFESEAVLTMRLNVSPEGYPVQDRTPFFEQVLRGVGQLPEVRNVGSINMLPLDGVSNVSTTFKYGGEEGDAIRAEYRWIRGDYFAAMGIPLVQGRMFRASDRLVESNLAVVSEDLARHLWGDSNAIGRQFQRGSGSYNTVIGIVGGVRNWGLDQAAIPQVYFLDTARSQISLVIQSDSDPASIVGSIVSTVKNMDSNVAISNIQTMNEMIGRSVANQRFGIFIAAVVSVISLLLSLFGVASLVAYTIEQDAHEIGVRLALGATVQQIIVYYVTRSTVLISVGLVGGLTVIQFIDVFARLLYRTEPWDPVASTGTCIIILGAGIVVSFWTARRVSRLNPKSLLVA